MNGLLPVIGLLIVLAIVVSVIKMILPGPGRGQVAYPYRRVPSLFTPAERSFLGVLEQAVQGQSRIFGKVGLRDVIDMKPGLNRSARRGALNKIQSKHVDFVLCDPKDLSIQLVIELDDSSHQAARRQVRDAFLDKALAAADVRILHFSAKSTYSVHGIREAILKQSSQRETPRSLPD